MRALAKNKIVFAVGLCLLMAVSFLLWHYLGSAEKQDDHNTGHSYAMYTAGDELSEKELDQLNIDVRLLLAKNCYKCHNSTKHKAALILDTKEGIFEGGENGAILEVGNSGESEMIRRLKLSSRNEEAMPPEGKRLNRDEIDLLSLWIDQGAHWVDTTLKLFREAPLALTKPTIPQAGKNLDNPIDLFVSKYFDEHNIKWPDLISDQRFIRKAYLDLTGLLPSTAQIDQFVQDTKKSKYAALIDELLADQKNYALHWLSFWNDLLRNDYSGTGYIDGGRKQITEWLYNSLADDKPYDKMIKELINPDEHSEGFIKGIQWRGAVNASQRRELQAAQNISQSLLGINLKCASCHNSFVNNVTLEQAYAFANVFADTSLEIYQCDKPTGKFTASNFIYPELGVVAGDSLKERLASLSDIMVSPENGRLFRTIVNRYWDKLFGRGIVAPVDDMDQIPWSQDLLDWLASDLIENAYDFKHLLRTILTSQTYRLEAVSYASPDLLTKEEFVFKGPVPRRLTAEQFTDAFTQGIYPFYAGVEYTQSPVESDANWIWHPQIEVDRQVLPKPGTRWFRSKFSLTDLEHISEANVLITADSSFQLFINNQEIVTGNDWRQVVKASIPVSILKDNNCIAVQATNDGLISNPAGILFSLQVVYPNTNECVFSDRSWVSTDTIPGDQWLNYEYIDTAWSKVRSFGSKGYWGFLTDFNFDGHSDVARAALVKKDQFMLSLGRPSRENVATTRAEEATLLQAMTLSNDELLSENIRRGAVRLQADKSRSSEEKFSKLFYRLIGRNANAQELEILRQGGKPEITQENWEDIIWAVVMLPEFHLI